MITFFLRKKGTTFTASKKSERIKERDDEREREEEKSFTKRVFLLPSSMWETLMLPFKMVLRERKKESSLLFPRSSFDSYFHQRKKILGPVLERETRAIHLKERRRTKRVFLSFFVIVLFSSLLSYSFENFCSSCDFYLIVHCYKF